MKQPIKMTPGDELHLTALMVPFSLNLVTGPDRQHLLGYDRAAFDAGKDSAGKCLHQIQEPAPVQAAKTEPSIRERSMAMCIKQLAWLVRRKEPDSTSAKNAMELLRKYDLLGSPLRGDVPENVSTSAALDGVVTHCQSDVPKNVPASEAVPAAVAVPDAVADAEKLLRAEAARLERIYGSHGNKWYGFCAEKASHLEHLRVADALATTPAADAQWLQPKDLEALQRFEETASDNQGHDIDKASVARLAGFGCLQSHGFGVYSITDFGHFVLDDWEHARTRPFRTQAERDTDQRAAIAAKAAQEGGAA